MNHGPPWQRPQPLGLATGSKRRQVSVGVDGWRQIEELVTDTVLDHTWERAPAIGVMADANLRWHRLIPDLRMSWCATLCQGCTPWKPCPVGHGLPEAF